MGYNSPWGRHSYETTVQKHVEVVGAITDNFVDGIHHLMQNGVEIAQIADGNTPDISVSKSGNTTYITVDGEVVGEIEDIGSSGGGQVTIPTITSRRDGTKTYILVNNEIIATLNDGYSGVNGADGSAGPAGPKGDKGDSGVAIMTTPTATDNIYIDDSEDAEIELVEMADLDGTSIYKGADNLIHAVGGGDVSALGIEPTGSAVPKRKLIWHDEFDFFDTDKWCIKSGDDAGTIDGHTMVYQTDGDTFEIKNSCVHMTCKKLGTNSYAIPRICTKFNFRNCYIETKFKLTKHTKGIMGGVWMITDNPETGSLTYNSDHMYKHSSEIDIVEPVGDATGKVNFGFHCKTSNDTVDYGNQFFDVDDGWHTYGVDLVDGNTATIYIDGVAKKTHTKANNLFGAGYNPWTETGLNLLIDMCNGPTTNANIEQEFYVDYVRVFTSANNTNPPVTAFGLVNYSGDRKMHNNWDTRVWIGDDFIKGRYNSTYNIVETCFHICYEPAEACILPNPVHVMANISEVAINMIHRFNYHSGKYPITPILTIEMPFAYMKAIIQSSYITFASWDRYDTLTEAEAAIALGKLAPYINNPTGLAQYATVVKDVSNDTQYVIFDYGDKHVRYSLAEINEFINNL